MGHARYSTLNRSVRSKAMNYDSASVDEIFTQNRQRRIHDAMDPKDVSKRESCDSAEHPNTVPIQLYLDDTGSMGSIPHFLIKEGLPKLMGNLIQKGIKDASLMFGAIGDHECDQYPLQISQFESGDAELDMWLTRTYLEGGGGGNNGESYLLAWYFAANHTRTDSFEKRHKKGYVFTVGDEPCLQNLPINAVKEIMGNTAMGQENFTRDGLLETARLQNHVYHIHINHGPHLDNWWEQALGKNCIQLDNKEELANTIVKIIIENEKNNGFIPTAEVSTEQNENQKEDIIL